MTSNEPPQTTGTGSSERHPTSCGVSRRSIRSSHLLAAAAVGLGVTVAGCSGGSEPPSGASAGSQATAATGGSGSAGATPLAQAVAYAQCVRSHGVPNFPDPVQTPSGGYGYRTAGIDPNSSAFQGAIEACKSLPSPWSSTGQQLSPAQQQAWLNWAQCIRVHGLANFPDPTFSGREVRDSGIASRTPQLQSAMDACKSQMPSVGGLGG